MSITSAGDVDPKLIELIESMPQAILNSLPAGQPPPGVEPAFANPCTRVPSFSVLDQRSLLWLFSASPFVFTRSLPVRTAGHGMTVSGIHADPDI